MTPREFLQKEIEIVKDSFKVMPDGIPITCTILRSTGKIEKYITVRISKDVNNKFTQLVLKVCKQPNVMAVVWVMEAWASFEEYKSQDLFPQPFLRPSENPEKITVASIVFYTKDEKEMHVYRETSGRELQFESMATEFHTQFPNPFTKLDFRNYN